MFLSLRSVFGIVLCVSTLGSAGCRSKEKPSTDKAPSAQVSSDYGPPVGARVTGNGKVPSFEIALASRGATPEECLPLIIQAVSNASLACPALAQELRAKGLVTISFETRQGKLDPAKTDSSDIDELGLDCVHAALNKAMSPVPQQQEVRYLLQVRPLAS